MEILGVSIPLPQRLALPALLPVCRSLGDNPVNLFPAEAAELTFTCREDTLFLIDVH